MPRTLKAALLAGVYAGAFTVIASPIFVIGSGLWWAYPKPWWQYWLYLPYAGEPLVRMWLLVSGLPAAILPLALAAPFLFRGRYVRGWPLRRNHPATQPLPELIRTPSDVHGHSRWASLAEMRALWPGPTRGYGGIVVGEAYDPRADRVARVPFNPRDPSTWGQGGKAPLLIDPCVDGSTHSLVIAGSGSYKSVCVVSSLLTWRGSAVVLDPATELGPMLRAARERMGHAVHVLRVQTADIVGFNALDWIDINSPMAETSIASVVEWVCGDTSNHQDANTKFFKALGKSLVNCLLLHLLFDPGLPPSRKTLRTLRAGIELPEEQLRKVLRQINRTSHSDKARGLAGNFVDMVSETFSGALANAGQDTEWLATRAYADLVSGDSFKSADITNGRTTVFVSLPMASLMASPGVARCIIGALLNAAFEADGAIKGRVLFLLDEAARLGRMAVLEHARDAGRKYRISLHLIYQSVGQIVEQWTADGKRAWYESVSWRSYAAVKDLETAKELSESIGDLGVLSWAEARNTGGKGWFMRAVPTSWGNNLTYSEAERRLLRPEEVMNDLRQDCQIILAKNARPVICGRAIYFRRKAMRQVVGSNRFAKP